MEAMPTLERAPIEKIRLFGEVLEDEFRKETEGAKEAFRQTLIGELAQIKDNLLQLLAENEVATDLERLERDEFVIDCKRRDRIEQEGEQECSEIRKEAEKTVLRLELLRERVKESTWDKMEVQSRAVKSIQSDTLIFNYPVRKRENNEMRVLNIVINQRRMELQEKLSRLESGLKESLEEEEFSHGLESYLMNRARGKPIYEDDNAI